MSKGVNKGMSRGVSKGRHARRMLLVDDRGAEQMEYVLLLAAVVLPCAVAARLLWAVLLHYFSVEALILDLPLF